MLPLTRVLQMRHWKRVIVLASGWAVVVFISVLICSNGRSRQTHRGLAAYSEDSLSDHLPTQVYLIVKVTPVGGCHGDGA